MNEQDEQLSAYLTSRFDAIMSIVSEHFNIDTEIIKGRSRKNSGAERNVDARHFFILFAAAIKFATHSNIGAYLSNRKHPVISQSMAQIEALIKNNTQIANDYEQLRGKIYA